MLSPLDDLPIHQVAAPIRQPGTSEPQLSTTATTSTCHPCSDELFLIIGQGPVPETWGVTDAFALIRRGDEHRVVARVPAKLGPPTGWTTSVRGPFPGRGDRGA